MSMLFLSSIFECEWCGVFLARYAGYLMLVGIGMGFGSYVIYKYLSRLRKSSRRLSEPQLKDIGNASAEVPSWCNFSSVL